MNTATPSSPLVTSAVNRLVPFVHVADVEASLAFYALLGFVPQNMMKDAHGCAFWALAQSGKGEIMLARADGPVDAEQQAVLFYMYSTDVAGLRRHLLESGLRDGSVYPGVKGPNDGPSMVFEVAHPHYMPAGEVRVADPDGYVILVGQLE
jgi:catechol 2,3-dioxygenase-like lactoylglutathione lyase family enzyme